MTAIVADISMSLDGFVTGPRPDLEHGLGVGGEALHTWAMSSEDPVDKAALETSVAHTGVVVMGRRTFDIIDGPYGWSDDVAYGDERYDVVQPPVLVVTHKAPVTTRLGPRFRFCSDGLAGTLHTARRIAGDRDVVLMGGGELIRTALETGLVQLLRLHLAPVLLGSGAPLFAGERVQPRQLQQVAVQVSPHATHLTYEVLVD